MKVLSEWSQEQVAGSNILRFIYSSQLCMSIFLALLLQEIRAVNVDPQGEVYHRHGSHMWGKKTTPKPPKTKQKPQQQSRKTPGNWKESQSEGKEGKSSLPSSPSGRCHV